MGINMFLSSSSFDSESNCVNQNPDPNNYTIIESFEDNGYLLIKIKYLDCTNYEGNKVLLFKNCTLDELINQKTIDPHFSENNEYKSPIARFTPTENGWNNALLLISLMRD